jgi:energy-coupling factor transport system permease protein
VKNQFGMGRALLSAVLLIIAALGLGAAAPAVATVLIWVVGIWYAIEFVLMLAKQTWLDKYVAVKSLIVAVLLIIAAIMIWPVKAVGVFPKAVTWALAFWAAIDFVFILGKRVGWTKITGEYTTYDIMVMAVLIAAGGVLKAYWAQVRVIVESLTGPFGSSIIIGPGFYMFAILACYLVRKPLSGTISMVLGGVIEILAGNPFGLPVLLFNFWEGLGPDIAYAIFRFKKYTLWVALIAGLLASYFGVFYGWYYFGFSKLPFTQFLIYLLTRFLGGLLAGILGHYLGVGLEKVGVRPPAKAVVEG